MAILVRDVKVRCRRKRLSRGNDNDVCTVCWNETELRDVVIFRRKIVIVCGYFRKLITRVVRGWLDGLLFLRDVAAPVPCYDGVHFKTIF